MESPDCYPEVSELRFDGSTATFRSLSVERNGAFESENRKRKESAQRLEDQLTRVSLWLCRAEALKRKLVHLLALVDAHPQAFSLKQLDPLGVDSPRQFSATFGPRTVPKDEANGG